MLKMTFSSVFSGWTYLDASSVTQTRESVTEKTLTLCCGPPSLCSRSVIISSYLININFTSWFSIIQLILICLDRFWLKRTGTSSCLRAWSGPATGQLSTLSLWWLSGTTSSSTCWSPSWWRASPTRYSQSPDCVPPTLYSYWTRSVHNNELSMAWNLCSISIYFVTSLLELSI